MDLPTQTKTCPDTGEECSRCLWNYCRERDKQGKARQLTCERCGNRTDAGAWVGFVYVGVECLTNEDKEYINEELPANDDDPFGEKAERFGPWDD
jgi:hypothetical protein